MKQFAPDYYDRFRCIAGACKHNCCIGWEIDIDEYTLDYYNSIDGEMGDRLKKHISYEGETPHFCMVENERCPFLNDKNLCDIISSMGEDALCDICAEHPRFYNVYDDCEETGLGLCCEKVCELLFEDDNPFCCIEEGSCCDDDYNYVAEIRDNCFDILENTDSISDAINNLLEYVSSVSGFSEISRRNPDKKEYFSETSALFLETSPINDDWTLLINEINSGIEEICNISECVEFDSEYRKLTSYIIYRHFIESAYDYDLLDGICFAVVCMIFVHMYNCITYVKNGAVTKADVLNNVRNFSKQIEYNVIFVNREVVFPYGAVSPISYRGSQKIRIRSRSSYPSNRSSHSISS